MNRAEAINQELEVLARDGEEIGLLLVAFDAVGDALAHMNRAVIRLERADLMQEAKSVLDAMDKVSDVGDKLGKRLKVQKGQPLGQEAKEEQVFFTTERLSTPERQQVASTIIEIPGLSASRYPRHKRIFWTMARDNDFDVDFWTGRESGLAQELSGLAMTGKLKLRLFYGLQ